MGEPKNITCWQERYSPGSCLSVHKRARSDPFVSLSFQNQWTGYKKETIDTSQEGGLSANISGKTQRKRCYEHSSLNLWGISAGSWGLSPKEMLNQTLNPRAGCITLICGPHFRTREGALPLSRKIIIISPLTIQGLCRATEECMP